LLVPYHLQFFSLPRKGLRPFHEPTDRRSRISPVTGQFSISIAPGIPWGFRLGPRIPNIRPNPCESRPPAQPRQASGNQSGNP